MLFHDFVIISELSADEIAVLLNENISQPPSGFWDGVKKLFVNKSFTGNASNQGFKLRLDKGHRIFEASCIAGTIFPFENKTKIHATISMDGSDSFFVVAWTMFVLYFFSEHFFLLAVLLCPLLIDMLIRFFYLSLPSTKLMFLDALQIKQ